MNQPETAPHPQSAAPTSPSEIPGLARVETIGTDPHVRIGGKDRNATDTASRLPRNTLLGDFVGGLLKIVARVLNPNLIELTLGWAKNIGHFAVLGGGVLTVAYAIYAAIKEDSFATFAMGIAIAVALAVAQFAAMRFLGAAETAIAATPSRTSSPAFLECVGLLSILGALGLVVSGTAAAIAAQTIAPMIPGLLLGLSLACFGALALHPQTVNVAVAQGSAGEEAIGLLAFFFKSYLKLVPLFFGLLATAGAVTVLASFFGTGQELANLAQGLVSGVPMLGRLPFGFAGSSLVLFACLLPIAAYFFFLIQFLVIDVIRAILAVPGKLDALKQR